MEKVGHFKGDEKSEGLQGRWRKWGKVMVRLKGEMEEEGSIKMRTRIKLKEDSR
jgi:hypothetical protein